LSFELMRRAHLAATPGREFGLADTGRFIVFAPANSLADLQRACARLQALSA
jgi:aspartate/methionine/tyrosine aminotransferase